MHLRLVPPPGEPHESAEPRPADALVRALDELLATPQPLPDETCARLAALAASVPGRQRAVAAALGQTASSAAFDALLTLPTAPGTLEALTRCLARGVVRRFTPLVLVDSPLISRPFGPDRISRPSGPDRTRARAGAPEIPGLRLPPRRTPPAPQPDDGPAAAIDAPRVLALDFRSSRTRSFPELVRRAQAVADQARGCAEFTALAVHGAPGGHHSAPPGPHHYRLSFWTDRATTATVAATLRAVHLDLTWLHARLVRLRGTRLWLSGWSFSDDHPIGPAAQAHLLQAWLRCAEQEPAS